MTRRQRLTPRERKAMYRAQDGKCACGECGGLSLDSGPVHEEHSWAICLGGPAKPDRLVLAICHKAKTADDKRRKAKLDRFTGKTRSQWTKTNRHRGRLGERCDSPTQAAHHAAADASSVVEPPIEKGKRRARKSRVAPAMHRSPKRSFPKSHRKIPSRPMRSKPFLTKGA